MTLLSFPEVGTCVIPFLRQSDFRNSSKTSAAEFPAGFRDYYRQLRQILYVWKRDGIAICSKKNNIREEELEEYVLGKLAYYFCLNLIYNTI